MTYRVRWQLVGRSGQPLDNGCLAEGFCAYGDAAAAVAEFLRAYPEVSRCPRESFWLARRSSDADLAVWIWIECRETKTAMTLSAAVADLIQSVVPASRQLVSPGTKIYGPAGCGTQTSSG